jgi:hypothetical protein
MIPILSLFLLASASSVSAQVQTLQDIISTYGLNAGSFNYTVPTRALESDDTYDWIKENWDLTGNKIDYGVNDMYIDSQYCTCVSLTNRAFTADPSTSNNNPVRRQASSSSSSSRTRTSSSATPSGSQAPITTSLGGEEPVFRVGYPEGSYSGSTGGTQFYSQALNVTSGGQDYERMLLAYDIWFPTGYAYVFSSTASFVRDPILLLRLSGPV